MSRNEHNLMKVVQQLEAEVNKLEKEISAKDQMIFFLRQQRDLAEGKRRHTLGSSKARGFCLTDKHITIYEYLKANKDAELTQLEIQDILGSQITWRPYVGQLAQAGVLANMGRNKQKRKTYKYSTMYEMNNEIIPEVGIYLKYKGE